MTHEQGHGRRVSSTQRSVHDRRVLLGTRRPNPNPSYHVMA